MNGASFLWITFVWRSVFDGGGGVEGEEGKCDGFHKEW